MILLNSDRRVGAHARIRTGDLFLTKEMLYRLSYMGVAQFDFICYKLGAPMPTINEALVSARRRITRLTPEQANAEHSIGALLVDTRTESQRRAQGEIPGALVIDRTVLRSEERRVGKECGAGGRPEVLKRSKLVGRTLEIEV